MDIRKLVEKAGKANLQNPSALKDYFEAIRLLEAVDFEKAHELNKTVRQLSAKYARQNNSVQMFELNKRALLFDAPHDFDAFMQYIEWNREPSKRFYRPRRKVLLPIVRAMQEVNDGKVDLLTVSQPKRTGKAVPVDTKVLTPGGWRRIGDLKVGDPVMSAHGAVTKVIGVFPQGKKRVYEVHFEESGGCKQDTVIECCKDHLWTVSHRKYRSEHERRVVMSTEELMNAHLLRTNGSAYYSVDYVRPMEFPKQSEVLLDPYLMGQLLGDGTLTRTLTLTTADNEVVERFRRDLPDGDTISACSYSDVQYHIVNENKIKGRKSATRRILEHYGLSHHTAPDKYIPKEYLYASVHDRLELLRGLLDSDGTTNGGILEFSTISEHLRDDVMFLIRSLGGRARYVTRMGSYTRNGQRIKTRVNYRVYGAFPAGIQPFWLDRKASKFQPQRSALYHYITGVVETDRYAEMVCIAIEDSCHQYVITDMMIPTHNSTLGEWFGLFRAGRAPFGSSIFSGSGNDLVKSFYNGILDVLQKPEEYLFYDVFPNAQLIATNADEKTIHLSAKKRFATITCRSIDGALTGSTEATPDGMLYLDDLVSDEVEANNRGRLDTLWDKVRGDLLGRRLEGCPIIAQGTRYSLYDPIGRLQEIAPTMGWRTKVLEIPALDPVTDESNFEIELNGKKMFTTEYYRHERELVTAMQWASQFQQEPFEAKGMLFPDESLQRYFRLPDDVEPDAILAVGDTAEGGGDSVMMPVAYIYGEDVFIEDVVFDNATPDVTKPECANVLLKHKVGAAVFESNAAGVYYARDVEEMVKKQGGRTSIRTRRTITNKQTRIELASDNIKKHFFFKDKSLYKPTDQYGLMMKELTTYTRSGKVKHDDAPDGLALLENEIRNLTSTKIEVFRRYF